MLEKEKGIDAVKIMTPDHLHGVIAIAAMKRGKHVITHKPISNRLKEAQLVVETARKTGVSTHLMPWDSNGDMAPVMAWINSGAIGTLREVHNWSNRPVWPQYSTVPTDRPPVPEGFDWDLWLGPEAERPYHPNYTHMVFRGWYDFGGGSMADMGHYSLWTVFNALELAGPTSVEPMFTHACSCRTASRTTIRNDFLLSAGERGALPISRARQPRSHRAGLVRRRHSSAHASGIGRGRRGNAGRRHDVRRRQGENSFRLPIGRSAPDSAGANEGTKGAASPAAHSR